MPDFLARFEGLLHLEPVEPPEPPSWVLGQTEPTDAGLYTPAAVTGPRVPETSMRVYDGDLTNVAEGELLDRLIITGRFRPEASTWTLRDSIVEGGQPPAGESMWPLLDCRESIDLGTIEHVEARPSWRGYNVYGLKGGNVDVVRSIIRRVVDGAQPHGSGSYPNTTDKRVRLLGCLVDDLTVFDDPGQSDGVTHNDGMQSAGALALLSIVGCALHGGRTSAILLQQNQGLFQRVLVALNWLYGDASEGSTFNTSQNGRGIICADGALAVIGNRFARAREPVALVSESTLAAASTFWFGNVYMDDGSEVVPRQGAD